MKKLSLRQRLLAVIIGVGALLIGGSLPEVSLNVYAAEPLAITGLEVTTSDDGMGVVAKCSYQNYSDQSGCVIALYLYKVDNGSYSIVTNKVLTYADEGSESTDSVRVTDGVYLASVTMDFGIDIKQINSGNYFRIKQVDGGYEVTEEGKIGTSALADHCQVIEKDLVCNHDCEYILEKQATPTEDAVNAYQCVKCRTILEKITVPNSAYATFLEETAFLIQNTQQSEVLIITDRWISFNREVIEAIKCRPDVTVRVQYHYQGKEHLLLIPAGVDVSLLVNESEFYGFKYVEEVISLMASL